MHLNLSLKIAVASTALLVAACGRTDTSATDTAAADTGVVAPIDTGMGSMRGMDHSTMNMPAARDADQEFLRMMVDHHHGLVVMADTALARNPSAAVATEARAMRQKQAAEQKTMTDMLKADYSEDKMPMVMPSNAQMIAHVASASGAAVDRAFREQVIAHHEEALRMIAEYETRFTKPAVKSMAEKMRSNQQKEIVRLKVDLGKG